MTLEEFKSLPFTFVSHISMEDEHVSIYENKLYGITAGVSVPYMHGSPHAKSRTVYVWNGEKYRSANDLLSAINKNEAL